MVWQRHWQILRRRPIDGLTLPVGGLRHINLVLSLSVICCSYTEIPPFWRTFRSATGRVVVARDLHFVPSPFLIVHQRYRGPPSAGTPPCRPCNRPFDGNLCARPLVDTARPVSTVNQQNFYYYIKFVAIHNLYALWFTLYFFFLLFIVHVFILFFLNFFFSFSFAKMEVSHILFYGLFNY